ncbi:hypothetical protein [Amycolatopsis sp. NBC_01286]|uniref:hypothetical protein n=1 Tax=Amycolatopsis sp. NBC_01286 TaxID=2903560 RepID=UPI002E14A0A0|nr:hypothetical protein OG570_16895 [Amycolatopsis sp. NBC_01286]
MLHEIGALTLPPILEKVATEARSILWYRDDITDGWVGRNVVVFQGYRLSPERTAFEERLRQTLNHEDVVTFGDSDPYGAVVRSLLSLHADHDKSSHQRRLQQLRSAQQAASREARHPETTVLLLLAALADRDDDGLAPLRAALDCIAPVATSLRPTLDIVEALFGVACDAPGTPKERGGLAPQVIAITDALVERLPDPAYLPFLAHVGVECRSWLALARALVGDADVVRRMAKAAILAFEAVPLEVVMAASERGWRMPGSGFWWWPQWDELSLERIADGYLLLGLCETARQLLTVIDEDSVGMRMYTRAMERLGLEDR